MALTATQKILAAHAGKKSVEVGELITAEVDLILGNDITTPLAAAEFRDGEKVLCPDNVVLVLDHFVPCKDIKSAEQCKIVREFAKKQGIKNLFDAGASGVEHALLPEKGFVRPSSLIIGADSHTCTYGALGCFSTGVGSTDMAAAMLTGKTWFRIPSAIKVELSGKLRGYATGKDLALTIIGLLGVDGATYKSLEFSGAETLTVDERMTVANMAVECGAKNAFFPIDDLATDYLLSTGAVLNKDEIKRLTVLPDADAVYERTVKINLDDVKPCVAFPHLPSNVHAVDDVNDVEINQVVIGSCTNGRLSDMRQAAEILRGRKVKDGVRCIVIPATPKVYADCLDEGIIKTFIEAGAVVSTPTCGPCLGGYMGILGSGERAVSTTNRNFVGRMGAASSEVYLASPYVAAASAVTGKLSSPEDLR